MKWNLGFILLGTQFAGGVFLGTALMQFLSDSNRTFQKLTIKDYPFAFMLATFGFLLAMLVDCVVVYVYRKRQRRSVDPGNFSISLQCFKFLFISEHCGKTHNFLTSSFHIILQLFLPHWNSE